MNREESIEIFRNSDAVCLDVDSTVCQDEGIDSLASFCNCGEKVKEWTNQAMGGSVTFQESFRARLEILNPHRETIEKFLSTHPPLLTPGVKELVVELKSRGCSVFLVSGGMRELIEPVAKLLAIDSKDIFANRLKYYYTGEYAGFDETCPTSRSGGKPAVVEQLKKNHGFKKLVMIGDGATDMEASPPADAFIGFGGNVKRPIVEENAKLFVTSFKELLDLLEYRLSGGSQHS